MTVGEVFRQIWRNPKEHLISQWNWKSALFSPGIRAIIFLCANLTAGWRAALAAAFVDVLYRGPTAGIYGGLTQAFRKANPPWAASLTVMILLPLVSHSMEVAIHLLRGTPRLRTSIICSVCFTGISTLFNLFAMRRGVLVVGSEAGSVAADMRQIPCTIAGFLAAGQSRSIVVSAAC